MAVLAAGCGGSSPTTPQPSPQPGPSPSPGPHTVTGSIVNALNDAPAPSVSFTVNGTLVGLSQTNGTFTVGFPATGLNRTVLTASGYVTRETGVTAPGGGLTLSLIPASFDLASFDQMFRHQQLSGAGPGLTRWTTAPGLVLERRVIEFTDVCAQSYAGIDETIPQGDADSIITDMRDGLALLTNGRLGPFASVTTQQADTGAAVVPRQPGRIVVMRGRGLQTKTTYWGYACWSTTPDGEVTGGFIVLDRDFDTSTSPSLAPFHRSLRMHELGHTLGCQHVTNGRISVMNTNARTEPNDFDKQAARLAMLRPAGNRSPDTDPVSHIATAAARTAQPLIWHGAH